jgi:hypothetical protein
MQCSQHTRTGRQLARQAKRLVLKEIIMTIARTLTIKEATQAARKVFAKSSTIDAHGWIVEECLRSIGTGFHIPAKATADGDDARTQGNFAKWLRANAVDTAAATIARREEFHAALEG